MLLQGIILGLGILAGVAAFYDTYTVLNIFKEANEYVTKTKAESFN